MAKYEKFFAVMARAFIFAIPLVPLFFSSSFFFPYTFTKTALFRALVELAFLFWLPLIVFFPSYRPKFSLLVWLVSALFALGWVSALFGPNFQASFWSDYERMMGLVTYTHFWVFFLAALSVVRREKDWVRLFSISLAVSVAVALYGIWQKFFVGLGRIESTFGNASFLASYLLIHIFVALAFLFRQNKFNAKSVFFTVTLAILLSALLFTATRGALLGLLWGIFMMLLLISFSKTGESAFGASSARMRIISRSLLALFFITVVAFFIFRENLRVSGSPLLARLSSVSFQERTVKARFISWQMAWEGIKERPILGWGPENFILLSNKHYDPRLFDQEAWFDRAHNVFFDLTAANGFAGAILLAGFIFFLFRKILLKDVGFYEKALLFAGSAAYLIADLFSFDNAATLIPVTLAILYIAADTKPKNVRHSVTDRGDALSKKSAPHAGMLYGASAASLTIFIFVFWNMTVLPVRDNFQARAAWAELYQSSDKIVAAKEYEETVSNGRYLDIELNRAFADFVIDAKKEGVVFPLETEKEIFKTAFRLIAENIEFDPKNVRWYVYEGNLYNLARDFDTSYSQRAEETFKHAISLSPRRQQIYFDLAEAEFDQGKTNEAFLNLDIAIALEPDYLASYRHKAAFAILAGRDAVAREGILRLRKNFIERDAPFDEYWDIFADAYFKKKKFKEAAELYRESIDYYEREQDIEKSILPAKLAERYARMAALWAMAGESENAYRAALRVAALDPSRHGEVDTFLKTIGRNLP